MHQKGRGEAFSDQYIIVTTVRSSNELQMLVNFRLNCKSLFVLLAMGPILINSMRMSLDLVLAFVLGVSAFIYY